MSRPRSSERYPGRTPEAVREVATPHGPARISRHDPAGRPAGLLVLGHGAGGGIDAPDLVTVTGAALAAGFAVVLVEQPYRVAGRLAPAPAGQLDTAWLAVVEHAVAEHAVAEHAVAEHAVAEHAFGGPTSGGPLLFGGRSSGARVACRTATAGGASGVLCLAFPVRPPGRPEKHRLAELAAPRVPVLVVQGERDPFGRPDPAPGREVAAVRGDHSLAADLPAVAAAAGRWLAARTTDHR